MAFSVNTNLGALQAYNALAKVNAETQKAQLRLATTKRINSVADDTSGFSVGKRMEAQVLQQKAQLNNVSSAKNFLSTAESALSQVNDKLNQIKGKYTDSLDPLKDQGSIAADIRTLAGEIDSILKSTNINGTNLLAKTDGTALAANSTFDVSGSTFTVDYKDTLDVASVRALLDGAYTDDSVTSEYLATNGAHGLTTGTSTITVTHNSGTQVTFNVAITTGEKNADVMSDFQVAADATALASAYTEIGAGLDAVATVNITTATDITSITESNTNGESLLGYLGIALATGTGGLNSATDATAIAAANGSGIDDVTDSVRSALGRIGNLMQSVESRSDFLTSSIANNTSAISNLFDADMAAEQLNATKGSISGQIGTAMLAQLNSAPQNILSLFR